MRTSIYICLLIVATLVAGQSAITSQQFYGKRKVVRVPKNEFLEVDLRTKYTFRLFGWSVFQCELTPEVLEVRRIDEGEGD